MNSRFVGRVLRKQLKPNILLITLKLSLFHASAKAWRMARSTRVTVEPNRSLMMGYSFPVTLSITSGCVMARRIPSRKK